MERVVVWSHDEPFTSELARVAVGDAGAVSAAGVAMGVDPLPYLLEYRLEYDDGFAFRRLAAASSGEGWSRELELALGPDGWSVTSGAEGDVHLPPPGAEPADLHAATDAEIARSPFAGTPAVLREGLLAPGAGEARLVVAWVSVPSLFVKAARQLYAPAGERRVRVRAVDSRAVAELVFDTDGLVAERPGLARRLR